MKNIFLTLICFMIIPMTTFALSSDRCLREGETFSPRERGAKCCKDDNLKPIRLIREINGKCAPISNQPFTCSRCGDSKCSGDENFCNCRRDCKKTK